MPRNVLPRRAVLAGIAASPAAIASAALPSAVLAHPGPVAADADLIAQAERMARLAKLMHRAYERLARKQDAVLIAVGPAPVEPDAWGGSCNTEEHPVDPASDVERRCTFLFRRPPADYAEMRRRHTEADAARQAEKARQSAAHGIGAAAALCDALLHQVIDATDALAGMPAASHAGLAAKAAAFIALMDRTDSADERETALALSLARDMLRVRT